MLLSATVLFGIAAISSLLFTPLVCRIATRLGMFDHPGFRKLHAKPIPRLGGVSVFASVLLAVLSVSGLHATGVVEVPVAFGVLLPLLLGCTFLFAVGLWDDVRHLSVSVKLAGQTVASLIPMLWGIRFERLSLLEGSPVDLGGWAFPVTLLWVLFMTNAWNLIDGLDGLASGLAIIAAGTFAALFMINGDFQSALVLLVLVGALAGFLWHNFYPAKIFLGDSGSLLLGYTLAVTVVVGVRHDAMAWPTVIPLLVLGLPIVDTAFVMTKRCIESLHTIQQDGPAPCLKRLRHFKRLFEADQHHIHYRLLAHGFSHRGAVLVLYGFAAFLSALALVTAIAD